LEFQYRYLILFSSYKPLPFFHFIIDKTSYCGYVHTFCENSMNIFILRFHFKSYCDIIILLTEG
jgi:hypothetical protein